MVVHQYQIVLVDLNPTKGSEINKTRPCVVISPDEMNRHLKTLVVAPMTTTGKAYPTRVSVSHKNKNGWIALDQIRTIDKKRVVRTFNSLTQDEIILLKKVLKETFVD